jgi:prephenate dehydrogenase
MCGANSTAVTTSLTTIADELDAAADALHSGDPIAALRAWFSPASRARRAWPPAPSLPAELPAHPDVLARLGRAGGWITGVAKDQRTVTAIRPAD